MVMKFFGNIQSLPFDVMTGDTNGLHQGLATKGSGSLFGG
jgi:hypothetical protein